MPLYTNTLPVGLAGPQMLNVQATSLTADVNIAAALTWATLYSVSYTKLSAASTLAVIVAGAGQNSGTQYAAFRVLIGAQVGQPSGAGHAHTTSAAQVLSNVSCGGRFTGLAAGTQTVEVQVRCSAANYVINASTSPTTHGLHATIIEVVP